MGADTPDELGRDPDGDELQSVVVTDDDGGADRRTLYPRGADDEERLTRWLSADDAAFVDLEELR